MVYTVKVKAFDMSINTNIEIFFSSIAFLTENRSSEEPFQWNGIYDCHFGIVIACCYCLRT